MGLLALFRSKPSSAQVARERLRIIVSQERNRRGGGPDYLPLLRKGAAGSHPQVRERRPRGHLR